MNQSISLMNEKISKMAVDKKNKLITKDFLRKIILAIIFSLSVFSIKYLLGIAFLLPLIYFLLMYDKKIAFITMAIISILSIIINPLYSLGIITAFVPLVFLIHKDNKKNLNYIILSLVTLMSYCINILLNIISFNFFQVLYILTFNLVFILIYQKAVEINQRKKNFLFKEDILAILAIITNLSICLYPLQISFFNVGLGLILLTIMCLGIMTNKETTIGYSLVNYCILYFLYKNVNGVEVIPVIGLISSFLPSSRTSLKAFLYYIITPVMSYFNLLEASILDTFFSVGLVVTIYYGIGCFTYHKLNNLLIPKYEDAKYYQIYVENFREDVSRRLLNFAELFNAFANKSLETNNDLLKLDEAIDELIDKHCKNCLKKELCHNINHIKTYNYFSQLLKEGDNILNSEKKRFLDLFGMYCLNAFEVINTAIELNQDYLLGNEKKSNNNLLFQSQLKGLSKILQDYAIEVNTDYESESIKLEKMRDKLIKMGFNIAYLKINSVKKKNIDIDFGIRNYDKNNERFLCDLLSDLLKEEVELLLKKKSRDVYRIKIISKKLFDLEFGTSYIGKDGSRISGDNYLKCDMHNGNTIIALSDGMGNGYSAHIESKSTLELLNKMLTTGADDHTAVSIINTLLSLKEYNERFSTLDYITINKSLGSVDFYKIGSAPSFIIRGNKVIRIDNENLPIGVSNDINKVSFDLELNDIVIIVSDGVVERFNNITKFEQILLSILRNSSIQIARDIIRASISEFDGKIADDMTVLVVKVNPCKNKVA